jgi:hypothetical protein
VDPAYVKSQLIEVLETIQRDSGFAPIPITGSTCPLDDLEGFDSKIAPVATVQLSEAISVMIPPQMNIFVSSDGLQHLTVDQIVAEVCSLKAGNV